MIKVLFMIINMNIGGMEKALLNMISEMDSDKYEITILMLERYGGFLTEIPPYIKVRYLENYKEIKSILNQPPKYISLDLINKKQYIKAFNIYLLHVITKLINDRTIYYKYVFKNYKKEKEKYDIAIAYAGPTDYISYYVLNKINAAKKVQWIHFDITKIGFNCKFAKHQYKKFNKIFIVSDEAKKKFINELPTLRDKVETFHNIISIKNTEGDIKENLEFTDDFKGLRILTVGRLSIEKGQDLLIPVTRKLIDDGYNVKWYCLGEGNARDKYEKLIDKYKVKDNFILLGSSSNPYKYISQCDIYVQSSRHEGYCITLAEAKMFNKPILTTNFVGAAEQITHNKTGLICECNINDIYLKIKDLIVSEKLRNNFTNNLKNISNKQNINDVDKLEKVLWE